MKFRNIIALSLLAIYALVMAHNFIPHHHHSELALCANLNETELHQHHDDEHECNSHHHTTKPREAYISLNHSYPIHDHTYCSFDDKIIRSEKINLPSFFALPMCFEYSFSEDIPQKIEAVDVISKHLSPKCRDVLRRGPPYFS